MTLDALRLPDETIAQQIPKLRRLRCEICDRREPDLEPIWPAREAEPPGGVDMGAAQWTVFIEMGDGQPGVSSPLWSRWHAAQFAQREIADGRKVVRIETPNGVVGREDVAAWCEAAGRS